jgi:hypothetical protein
MPPVLYAVSSLVVLVVLAQQGDLSVWIALGWFAAALLFHRVARPGQGAVDPVRE